MAVVEGVVFSVVVVVGLGVVEGAGVVAFVVVVGAAVVVVVIDDVGAAVVVSSGGTVVSCVQSGQSRSKFRKTFLQFCFKKRFHNITIFFIILLSVLIFTDII